MINDFLRNSLKVLGANIKNAPIAMLFIYTSTILVIYINIYDANRTLEINLYDAILKLTTTLIFGFFFMVAIHLLRDKSLKRSLTAVGVVIIVIYYLSFYRYLSFSYFNIQLLYLTVGSILLMIYTPFHKTKINDLVSIGFMKALSHAIATSFLLSNIVLGLIFIALSAFNTLLLNISFSEIYIIIPALIYGVFGSNYFLQQIRNYSETSSSLEFNSKKFNKPIIEYILLFFSLTYLLILYFYTIKILLTSDWPKGVLAWFILYFSLVSYISYFLLVGNKKEKIARIFLFANIPQAFMLILAVYKRVELYSLTEARYMLLLYGLLLIFSSFILLKKLLSIYTLFLIIGIIIMFSQVGFWSSWEVSKKFQSDRFVENLKLFNDGNRSKELTRELSISLRYLISRYGIDGLKPILPDIVERYKKLHKFPFPKAFDNSISKFVAKELGFKFHTWHMSEDFKDNKRKTFRLKSTSNIFSERVDGFNWFINVNRSNIYFYENDVKAVECEVANVKFKLKTKTIEIVQGDEVKKIDLREYIKNIYESNSLKMIPPFEYEDEDLKLKLIFSEITLEPYRFVFLSNFYIFFSIKNEK